MASILFASVPINGHVAPLLSLAREFALRGDRVRFLTGRRFRDQVVATGAEHIPLPAAADFDDRDLSAAFPERDGLSPVRALAFDVEHLFVRPGVPQYARIQEALREEPADAIVVDPAFAAGALLVGLPAAQRPAVVVGGVIPLNLSAPGLAPFGFGLPPLDGVLGRLRNAVLGALVSRVFAPVDRAAREVTEQVHGRGARVLVMDWIRHAEQIVQCAVPSFEYPRAGAPVRFAGPVASSGLAEHPRPEWWPELDGSRPVIHVTQGTLANDDPAELILPTIEACADEDVLVVVATGGLPASRLGALPANVRVAEFLPYEELMPKTSLMVSNGGYGGVQFALRHGVPLVVAPGKEDKVEVAARTAWSGVGINLRRQRPRPAQLRRAVAEVLREPAYRSAARRLQAEIEASAGAAGFPAIVDAVVVAHRTRAANL